MRNRIVISDSSDEEEATQRKPRAKAGPKSRTKTPQNSLSQPASTSQSQRSLSQPGTSSQSQSLSQSFSESQEETNENEIHRIACLCTNFFLVANCKKVPIKRGDIGKLIPKEYSRRSAIIINIASKKLEEVFGYKAVELDKKGVFILTNKLYLSTLYKALPFKIHAREAAIMTLRTNILTVILMSDGVVQDSTLDEFVRHFGLDVEGKEIHPLLGNVQKLIYQDFVRQGYLDVTLHKDLEVPFKDIRWGSRARMEIDQMEVIKLVCKIYGNNIKPEMWVEQWKKATEYAAITNPLIIETEDES